MDDPQAHRDAGFVGAESCGKRSKTRLRTREKWRIGGAVDQFGVGVGDETVDLVVDMIKKLDAAEVARIRDFTP